MGYTPTISADQIERLREWHVAAYEDLRRRGRTHVAYLDRQFDIPASVFAPTPMSDLLGQAVLDDVRTDDRVLDVGTGCGVNAILAASKSRHVLGVDINPDAVSSATANAQRNGVDERTRFLHSDLFSAIEGRFDLIVFDPPFRWFPPRDLLEASITDENYQTLTRFFEQVGRYLTPRGRVLLSFGTSGDVAYVSELIGRASMASEHVADRLLEREELSVTYSVQRLRCMPPPASSASS